MAYPDAGLKRGHIELTSTLDPDGVVELTAGEQGLTIEVTDEVACGSYNTECTCRALLSRDDAVRLRDWLTGCILGADDAAA